MEQRIVPKAVSAILILHLLQHNLPGKRDREGVDSVSPMQQRGTKNSKQVYI